MLNRLRLWLRSNVLRRRMEREMREEMSAHIDRSTERLIARGMTQEDAQRQATREFGNVAYLQEEARYARGTIWLDALLADVRFALRQFARRPVTTIVMFVVLSVGMSISTLLFSYVHAYAVRPPLGVEADDGLVRIRGSRAAGAAGRGVRTFADDEFRAYRSLSDVFESVAGWVDVQVALLAADDVERRVQDARVSFVTENYFSTLGVQPIPGRGLPASESHSGAADAVAVIGHHTWDHLFARNRDAIGSTVTVNGVPVTIVGVAPERFIGMTGHQRLQLWMPLSTHRLVTAQAPEGFRAFGRLRPGVSVAAASGAVGAVAARTAATSDELRAVDPATDVVPLLAANGDPMFDRDVRLQTFAVSLLALLVLLVTCTNVSALLTGLATARRQEIAIRLSLGAPRGRIIRQLLTESALLATLAASAALGIVWIVLDVAARVLTELPLEVGITWTATSVTFGIAIAVGVLFGLSPALHATRLALAIALRDSTALVAASRARLQRGLVIAQVAFTQPLIVLLAAVLLFAVGGYAPKGRSDRPGSVVALSIRPTSQMTAAASTAPERTQVLRGTMRQLLERVRNVPGVAAAVLDWGGSSPLGAYIAHDDDRTAGVNQDAVSLSWQPVEAGYFAALDVPLLRGREFTRSEVSIIDARAPEVPVVISAGLARRLWAGADPLGRRLQAADDTVTGAATLLVVAVVDDPLDDMRRAFDPYRVYMPPDTSRTPLAILLRTARDAQPLLPDFRGVVQEAAPGAVVTARTLAEIEEGHRRRFRIVTGSLMTAGALALLLSALGLYAVVAFSVGQRTREIAVRMAVGGAGRQVARKFLADGIHLSAVGLAIGLPISLVGLNALMGVSEDIPRVGLGGVTAIAALGVGIVAAAAAWIPARRAVAVDPAITLRAE